MGYGLRNVASIPAALTELQRVLKPGVCVCVCVCARVRVCTFMSVGGKDVLLASRLKPIKCRCNIHQYS